MKSTKANRSAEDIWSRWQAIGESKSSLLARAEKAEQERDQALEKARERESARVIETHRADGMSQTLAEARERVEGLEAEHAATRFNRQIAERSYDREQRVVVRLKKHITELQAAQRPRPMDEAPKDGVIAQVPISWEDGLRWTDGLGVSIDLRLTVTGWLPLPDKDDDAS